MAQYEDSGDEMVRKRRALLDQRDRERERATVAQDEADEDWPLLTALFAGLAVALIVNTFVGLMPG